MKRIFVGLIALGLAIGLMLGCQLKEPAATIDQTQVSAAADDLIKAAADIFGSDITKTVYYEDTVDDDAYTFVDDDDPSTDDTMLDPDDPDVDISRADIKFVFTIGKADSDGAGSWEWQEWFFERGDSDTGLDGDGDGDLGEGWVIVEARQGAYTYSKTDRTLTVERVSDDWSVADDEYPAWSSSNEPPVAAIKTVWSAIIENSVSISDSEAVNGGTVPSLDDVADIIDVTGFYVDGVQETTNYVYESGYPSSKFTTNVVRDIFEFDEAGMSYVQYDNDVSTNSDGDVSALGSGGDYDLYEWTLEADAAIDSGAPVTLEDRIYLGNYDADYTWDSSAEAWELASSPDLVEPADAPQYTTDDEIVVQAFFDADGEVEGYTID